MAKQIKKQVYKPSAEREMRDRMNGIVRDEKGQIASIRGVAMKQIAEKSVFE